MGSVAQPRAHVDHSPGEAREPLTRANVVSETTAPEMAKTPAVTRRRWRPMRSRSVAWLEWDLGEACYLNGRTVRLAPRAALLNVLTGLQDAETVQLVGLAAPAVVVDWATTPAPEGWVGRRHYLDDTAPVAHFTHPASGRRVRITTAASWMGAGDYSAEQAAAAWRLAEQMLTKRFAGDVHLIGTPATTGRELLARTIPHGAEWPVLEDEHQELIRSTSGQGRAELFKPPGVELPGMVEMDMRLAYAAVAWGMPTGRPERHVGAGPDGYEPHRRGRYLISWTVPDGWNRPGILPAMHPAGGWHWPHQPGEQARGWVDGAELALARDHGWHGVIHESILWPIEQPHDPLKRWAAHIADASSEVELLGATGRVELHTAKACRAALRAVVLFTIGALHGTRHDITATCRIEEADATVPADALGVTFQGDLVVWREREPAKWPEMVHPEWSSAIWARTRCRLLDGPTGRRGVRSGALHVQPSEVIGFRTDALYLTEPADWPDDGKPGRFRPKGHHPAFAMPRTLAEFDLLRGAGPNHQKGIAAARAALRASTGAA